jgi:mannosyltransferase
VLAMLLILLLATGLRFYRLDAQSFWNDEGNSARLSERTLPMIIEGTASDIHPPLYYVMLRGWRELVGDSEFGLRSFSAFAGILTVATTLALARYLYARSSRKRSTAVAVLIAGLLAAVNPTLVYYSQETRMYAMLALLGVLSTLILLRWLDAVRRRPWILAYVLLTAAGLYTHYFYPVVLVLQGLVVVIWLLRRQITLIFDPLKLTAKTHQFPAVYPLDAYILSSGRRSRCCALAAARVSVGKQSLGGLRRNHP